MHNATDANRSLNFTSAVTLRARIVVEHITDSIHPYIDVDAIAFLNADSVLAQFANISASPCGIYNRLAI